MAEEEQEESVEEAGSSKKKLIIMVAGGVVLLAILAGAGLYFTGFFEEEKAPVTAESSSSEETLPEGSDSAEEGAEAEESGDAEETLYQALTPPFMVNFPDGNIKVIKVSMSLMVKDEKVISAVKKHDPVIRNNILMLLSSQDPEGLKTAEGKTQLQAVVKAEINKVLAERKVSSKVLEVFFTDLVMQ